MTNDQDAYREMIARAEHPFNAVLSVTVAYDTADPNTPVHRVARVAEHFPEGNLSVTTSALWLFDGTTALYDYLVAHRIITDDVEGESVIFDDRFRELTDDCRRILGDRDLADEIMPGEHGVEFFAVLSRIVATANRIHLVMADQPHALTINVLAVPAERKAS